jgi:metallo-beta-lactamase class B
VASAGDRQVLESQVSAQGGNANLAAVKVDRVIGQGDKITIGKQTLLAWMTPGHSPGCTTWTTVAREKKWNRTAVFYCSPVGAVNRLTDDYPNRAADYRKTYETSRGIIASVFLPPHPEMFRMEEKRPLIGQYGINPFVRSGEFHAFVREAEKPYLDPPAAVQKKAKWRSKTTVGESK